MRSALCILRHFCGIFGVAAIAVYIVVNGVRSVGKLDQQKTDGDKCFRGRYDPLVKIVVKIVAGAALR